MDSRSGLFASKSTILTNKKKYYQGENIDFSFSISDASQINLFDYVLLEKFENGSLIKKAWFYSNGKTNVVSGEIPKQFGVFSISTKDFEPGEYRLSYKHAASDLDFIKDKIIFEVIPNISNVVVVYGGDQHNAFGSVVEISPNHLLAVFRNAKQHVIDGPAAVLKVESLDGGKTWSAPSILYEHNEYDCAPGSDLIKTKNGDLILAIQLRSSSATDLDKTIIMVSKDNGLSWLVTNELTPYAVPYGKIIELDDGTLVLPAYGYMAGGGALYKSFDSGSSWNYFSAVVKNDLNIPFGKIGWTSYTETAVLPISSNEWVAFIRGNTYGELSYQNKIYFSRSVDGGKTWSSPEYQFEGASPELIRIDNLKILLCLSSRDVNIGYGVRCHLSIDNGLTWGAHKFLVNTNKSDSGYPSIIFGEQGTLRALFYYGVDAAETIANIGIIEFHPAYFN